MSASAPTPQAQTPLPRWAQERERSNRFALALMAWIALRCGRGVARWALYPITLYFLCFAPQVRRHSARYLGRALGRPAHWRDIYRHVHSFASTVLDRVYFARGQIQHFEIRMSGAGIVDEIVTQGRGAFFLGAHLGSFEALHAIGAQRPGMRVAMAMYPENARLIHSVLQAIAPQFELGIITIGRSGSTLAMRDWLDGGGVVGLLGDRHLPKESSRGSTFVERPFLGVPVQFIDGPLRLALLLRRRVVFMVALYRGGNRYDLRFEQLVDFSAAAGADEDKTARERRIQAALQDYVVRLEALCRESPYNWFNFYDYWHEDSAS